MADIEDALFVNPDGSRIPLADGQNLGSLQLDGVKYKSPDGRWNIIHNPVATDAQRASDIRAKLRPLLEQVCEIIGAARRDGLAVGFNLQPDQYGIQRVVTLDVSKPL